MIKLIHVEFLKLRRRKFLWLMFSAALCMPFVGVIYFSDRNAVEAMVFYNWAAFSFTQWIILPIVLGILCAMLMYEENRNDMLSQLWIVPISRFKYFIGKFVIVFLYSICFMAVAAIITLLCAAATGIVGLNTESILYLAIKCVEIGVLAAFSMLPILAVAASQKGYILTVCAALVYAFGGFILTMVNMYLHPLSGMTAITTRNIPGAVLNQSLNIPLAIACIALWGMASVLFANFVLARK